jgi:hypothetical protein
VNQISIFVLGSMVVFASAPAPAQDFTAGKTPAQLFSSDCAECHHSPNGLGRGRDVRTLAGFLRQHYTTKSQTASALAVYVAGFSGGGAAGVNNRGAGVATPANTANERSQADRRTRTDSEATATGEDTRTSARPVEDPAARRPRSTTLSVDGEKRRARNDGDVPRPPASIATTAPASAKLNAAAGDRAPHAAADPISRLRSYLSSGLDFESTVAEAAKMGAPKGRKRPNRVDNAEPPPSDVQTTAKTVTDAPPAVPPSATIDATAPEAPPEGNALPASDPSVPPAVTQPRLEQ